MRGGANGATRVAQRELDELENASPRVRHANRSARRKSARHLFTENHGSDEDDELVRDIWDDGDAEESSEDVTEDGDESQDIANTPSKSGRRGPGVRSTNGAKSKDSVGKRKMQDEESELQRPDLEVDADGDIEMNGKDEINENTPPPDPTLVKRRRGRPPKPKPAQETLDTRPDSPSGNNLPPHELYFWSNRPGASKKTSDNMLPPNILLDHEKFFLVREKWTDPHAEQLEFLLELHRAAFPQWVFELENEFSVCLYGYGSKRQLLKDFASYLHETGNPAPTIVMVNGLSSSPPTLVDILTTIAGTLIPRSVKLPSTSQQLLSLLLDALESASSLPKAKAKQKKGANFTSANLPIHLLISSLDAPSLRKSTIQAAIATLAAHQNIRLIATVDNPEAPLLWDVAIRGKFRFVHHDTSTFAPWDHDGGAIVEKNGEDLISVAGGSGLDPVEMVNTLLGRSGRKIGGRDGVAYVLRSLPENAKHLYRILVAEQIAGTADDGFDDEVDVGGEDQGVQFRVLYHKAREELVCSTEHQLRTLLKEFFDHQMVENRRDAMGTERLIVPFRKEELEALLEDLVE